MLTYAKKLAKDENDFSQNWLFLYEVLPKENLKGDWKTLKEANISFIKNDREIITEK